MKNSTAILPLVPFPNLFWLSQYLESDTVIIDLHENYIKQSARNRYEILNAQGRQVLSIPVVGQKGIKTPTGKIKISDQNWQIIHWRSIAAAYNSSPFFIYYQDEIEDLFKQEWNSISEFSKASLNLVLELLQIDSEHTFSASYLEQNEGDFRGEFKPVNSGFTHSTYGQVFSDRLAFESNLSVLDLLFNKGPESPLVLDSLSSK